jgi:F-type H+-transporting ATPase subunit b
MIKNKNVTKKPTTSQRSIRLCGYIIVIIFCIHLMSSAAFAGDAPWRPMYDKIMVWINFFILVFVAVKYGKKPFLNFLQGQTDEIAGEIHRLQKQKNTIDAQIGKTKQMTESSSIRFEKIKTRIIEEGERTKNKIIEDAKIQSKKIIELGKIKADNQIIQAKNQFMAEMVDQASKLAQKQLPAEITNQDQQQMLDHFISNIAKVPEQAV